MNVLGQSHVETLHPSSPPEPAKLGIIGEPPPEQLRFPFPEGPGYPYGGYFPKS